MDNRAIKLNKQLDAVLRGQQTITRGNAATFLESVFSQPEPLSCIDKVVSSKAGLSALQTALFMDFSIPFLNSHSTRLVLYLRAPELKDIGGGAYVEQIVRKIVAPAIFWRAFTQAFVDGKLESDGQLAFGWLLLQLIGLPAEDARPYREAAQEAHISDLLIASSNADARATGQKLKHILETVGLSGSADVEYSAGGRHDNDHVDFRQIAILPTSDEITSKEPAFLRTAAEVDNIAADQRFAAHLDNQFRLYREDMLYEIRDELSIISGQRKGRHRGLVIENLRLVGMHGVVGQGSSARNDKWGIILSMPDDSDLWFFKRDKPKDRVRYLLDDRKLIRDGSMTALIVDGTVVAFPSIRRDEDRLAEKPPQFVLILEGKHSTIETLRRMPHAHSIKLVQIDTAVFSFEPVLKALQEIISMPLSPELVAWEPGITLSVPPQSPHSVIEALQRDPQQDLRDIIKTPKSIKLDNSQAASLLAGLVQRVSIVQGPPGTGKSFIGALLAKIFHDFTTQTILVCCYTNHALDQFLEDLLDIGIPQNSIVRLGGKSTARTEPLSLYNQKRTSKFTRQDWTQIDEIKRNANEVLDRLQRNFGAYAQIQIPLRQILDHIEFDDPDFFHALSVPPSALRGDMRQVGKRGKAIDETYLLFNWLRGWDAGVLKNAENVEHSPAVWKMTFSQRQARLADWKDAILKEHVEQLYDIGRSFNDHQDSLTRKFAQNEELTLISKRIIGCTTTAAAKYTKHLQSALPQVVLVEEAGEILESHVLTALGEKTERLILIGDHKQLRPKVDNYALTVEKGDGYDLNRSLFERLVLRGYPHETLNKQHRMRPEISSYVRRLTYPDLVDAPGTLNRANIRGVNDNIVFITHSHPEDENDALAELREPGSKSSKQNKFEVDMIIKILRYLAQNGYGTDKIVILTPYLGQLHRIRETLQKEGKVDPVLGDLDSFDLVRAGLLAAGAAKVAKKSVRLATIDNYQGEESDIVLVSLTRSNSSNDIGFMSSPERLNVLLSRARDALIMIGNAETFSNARKGRDLWTSLFSMLKQDGHIYDGLPTKCERHSDRTAILKRPTDFDEKCPDGGCTEQCTSTLNCGIHKCPSRCHQLYDHSKMECHSLLDYTCPNGHRRTWRCHQARPLNCLKCEKAAEQADEKRRKDFEKQQKRDEEQKEHARRIAELDTEIEAEVEAQKERERAQQRSDAVIQKQRELADAKARTARQAISQASSVTPAAPVLPTPTIPPSQVTGDPRTSLPEASPPRPNVPDGLSEPTTAEDPSAPPPPSRSEEEWQRQKDMEGAKNPHVDAIMEMTGLEEVKVQVLRIKAKIDTSQRQGTSVKDERFNIVLQGNPGTGKTTVARHYAKFLESVDVLPGTQFIETTGSSLANDGVPGIKKQIEQMLANGGGAIFVDEAYQLTGEHNFGGGQVLDFLLAEMENNVGKIVFILAGYNKQMEKFFEHNPGLTSRVPYSLQFSDYTDQELLQMLDKHITKKYKGQMKVVGGMFGLYMRIAVRRLGRGRGKDGFGNARALQNMFNDISDRQAIRLAGERRTGKNIDYFVFAQEDIIGPDPSKAILDSSAWNKLHGLVGLKDVKQSIQNLFDLIATNYERELAEKEPIQMSLNRVFLGNPGTGKTTVAKLYGQVLADLGLLSNGEVVIKNPADFVGSVLGESEKNTKGILDTCVGKVLVIDEAYGLYGAASTGGKQSDPYKTAVIDTLVAEIQSVPGEDRCVLMCGYEPQMREMFQNVNPGLSRRFAIDDAFRFEDFDDGELLAIMNGKLKQQDLDATADAKAVAIDMLGRARNRPNFGNGGEVENLLSKAKGNFQARQTKLPVSQRSYDVIFEPIDFDPNFDRTENAGTNLAKLFEDVVGCEQVIHKLQEYQNIAKIMRAQGKEPREARELIPTNFVFKGPPGTGKTTTARKMGQVYYDMGFLSSTDVVECSASDLVGEYVGQTGPKTKKLFETALGKVLFIDEAYRLSEGHFAKEAMDELVGILTQEAFIGKLIVIIAGYTNEMNSLLSINPGLSSRFPEEIYFDNLSPERCLEILDKDLDKKGVRCAELQDPSSPSYGDMARQLKTLASLDSWGNARDVKTLAKQMVRAAYKQVNALQAGETLTLSGRDAVDCLITMLNERLARSTLVSSTQAVARSPPSAPQALPPARPPPTITPPSFATHTTNATAQAPPAPPLPEVSAPEPDDQARRDPGVSDVVWAQLQADKQAAEAAEQQREENLRAMQKELDALKQADDAAKAREEKLARRAKCAADDEARRKLEEERLRLVAQAIENATRARELAEKRQKEIQERKQEAEAQEKLRHMGVCPAGYRWVKQGGGYRCSAGGHFVSNSQLGM